MADELDRLSDEEYFERNYSGHGRGVVITNENGKFVERQMTNAELWARKPALEIAADIHKLACYAAFAYIKCWEFIAPVIETAMSGRDAEITRLREQLALKDADKDRIDWLNDQVVDVIYLDDGRIIDVRGNCARKVIDESRAAQALSPSLTDAK